MAIKPGDLVKWQVGEGFGFGKVIEASDDLTKVELPSGQTIEFASVDDLKVIEAEDYKNSLTALINRLIKQMGEGHMTIEEAQAKITELENALAEKDALIATETEAKTALTEEVTSVKAEAEKAKAELTEVQAKLAEIEKEKTVTARVSELGEAFILQAFKVEKVEEAFETIFNLDQKTFDIMKNMSEAVTKLTDVTETTAPKSTDQTITNETKLTEAGTEEVEQVASAELENDVDLSTASIVTENGFKSTVAKFLTKE